jgi:hypothetical protein
MSKELNKTIVAFLASEECKAWPKNSPSPDYMRIYDIPGKWWSALNDVSGIDNWDDKLWFYVITGGECEYIHLLDKNFTIKYTWCAA